MSVPTLFGGSIGIVFESTLLGRLALCLRLPVWVSQVTTYPNQTLGTRQAFGLLHTQLLCLLDRSYRDESVYEGHEGNPLDRLALCLRVSVWVSQVTT